MPAADRHRDIAAVAALDDPVRRALYEHVVAQPEPVSREQAAAAVGIGRSLAAFHLDRLVTEGLLEASYRRLTGRSGPGAGRPSKLYARARTEFAVSLPRREYELAARLLLQAVSCAPSSDAREALSRSAHDLGCSLAERARATTDAGAARTALREDVVALLDDQGFQPFVDEDGVIRLRNCPFHALAQEEPELICGMNLALIDGVVDGLGKAGVKAVLDFRPDLCCVALEPASRRGR